ncbi:MAG: GTPase Era [Deltaproteobacteria bacterium]|nr:GTPase Era [Deltaproteobacteria bacterium]
MDNIRSGFAGIIGRPNVGKSTLMNALIGERIAITTAKPQTTRNRITGIKNVEGGQIIFVDTPGIHRARGKLNRSMVETALGTLGDMDVILYIVDASKKEDSRDAIIMDALSKASAPVILVINKIDLVRKEDLLVAIDELRGLYSFAEIVPLSALKNFNVDDLTRTVLPLLPEGTRFFPEDLITDASERFLAAEMIREKLMILTHEEIPYAAAVLIESFKEDEEKDIIRIKAVINVEKDSQKGIIIGKGGSMLKKIGADARLDMEKFFGTRIFLELFVRVMKNWSDDPNRLHEFGYL